MKAMVFAVALCAMVLAGLTPVAQAGDGMSSASPAIAADEKGTVERCIKWVQQKIQVWVKDHYETRTVAVCAVRG